MSLRNITVCAARLSLLGAIVVSVGILSGCGDNDSPAGPSVTVSAPTPVSPVAGAEVTDQPTLVATNASVSNGSAPTYTFQVATDSAFGNIVAQATGIGQGSGGQTEWRVSTPLGNGQHFWRARASASGIDGPFSSAADFQVFAAFISDVPREGVLVFDPLSNGTSVGDVGGGEFTEQGWKVIASSNFIVYNLPPIEHGFVEFDVTGLDIRNPSRDARHLFFMWDPSAGSDMTTNPFRGSLQKLDNRSSINDRWLRLRFISQNRQVDGFSTFRGWVPDFVHHVRFEWGREGESLKARVLVDGDRKIEVFYSRPYLPNTLRVELGAAGRAETPENAVYSNVRIGVRQPM